MMAWMMYDDGYPPVVKYFKDKGFSSGNYFETANAPLDDIISFAESYTR
jgi:hypothetical protein